MPQAGCQALSRPSRDITPLLRVGLRTTISSQCFHFPKRTNSFDPAFAESLSERTEVPACRGISGGSLSQAEGRLRKSCEQVQTLGYRIQSSEQGIGILCHGGSSRVLRRLRIQAFYR
jgi:hypothetical protein